MSDLSTIDLIRPDESAEANGAGFDCPECERSFSTKSGLGAHRSSAHGVVGSGGHKRKKAAPRQPREPRAPTVGEQATGFYMLLADVWAIRDPVCAEALRQATPNAAQTWAALAKRYDWVARFWSDLGSASGWPGLLVAHMPLLLSISSHHIQPAIAARRAAAETTEEEDQIGGLGAFAEAPAG